MRSSAGRCEIGAQANGGAHIRWAWTSSDIGRNQRDATNHIRPQRRQGPRDPIAESVSDDERRTAFGIIDHGGNVGRKVFEFHAAPGPGASANTARLGPQNAIAGSGEPPRDSVEIRGAAAERRQQHNCRTRALRQNFEARFAARHLDARRRRCLRGHGHKHSWRREPSYDTFRRRSASHSGWSIITSWPVVSLTKVCQLLSALQSVNALSKAACGYFGARM